MSFTHRLSLGIVSGLLITALPAPLASGGSGDPQVASDHRWYPGELACSTFERLQRTQAKLFEDVVGRAVEDDEDRVLAAWMWRNTHFWHGQEGKEDLWGRGFQGGSPLATRDYWTGLFAHGFGLCGTTHAQWTAEMNHLLGHNRSRVVGVSGHNSFEVYLRGGRYGEGRWVLLDHDVSAILFDDDAGRLVGISEIHRDLHRLTSVAKSAGRQQGWPVCGLHQDDGGVFDSYRTAEYLAGYAGPPPMVHLRRGERLRRYPQPGLDDGQTFVFWGRNDNRGGILGPERSRSWVNQPERMYGGQDGSGYRVGQARFANAVYTYQPDFSNDDYREGVVEESAEQVTLEFHTPYIIAATPPNDAPWGVYDDGCRNGLVVHSRRSCQIAVSVDRGASWHRVQLDDGLIDLTDQVKGHRQYWLRFDCPPRQLVDAGVKLVTTCQANGSVIPRLTDRGSRVRFEASGQAIISAGPTLPQATTALVEGAFDSPAVTMQLAASRDADVVAAYAAAHIYSSNPPSDAIAYQIEYSLDEGRSWQPIVEDWRITRRGDEPQDFWSQSCCWGAAEVAATDAPVRVRFHNDGGKRYGRTELHLAYQIAQQDATRVTFCWQDDQGVHQSSHLVRATADQWTVPTGEGVETLWVEYEPVVP